MTRRTLFFGSVAVAAGAAIAWLSAPSVVAQSEGQAIEGGIVGPAPAGSFGLPGTGGFGAGFGAPIPSFAGEQIIQGGSFDSDHPSFFILTAPDKLRAWGYSTSNGDWKKAPVDAKAETAFVPIVGTTVAAIAEGHKVHAFSSLKGEWASLELPEGTDIGDQQPVVGSDYVQVRTASSVSIFSARTGNWATVKFNEK